MVDIFLIDWERPRGKIAGSAGQMAGKDVPVSIWRTYFVANEWNEIQTKRKINPTFQYFAVVFFLEVVGFGNLATMDPQNQFQQTSQDQYYAPMSDVLRFALIASTFIIVGK